MNGLYHYLVFRLTNYEALLPYDAMIVRCCVLLPACYCPKNVTFVEAGGKKAKQRKNTTNSQTTFHSNILPAFRAVKGSVGNIRQFTANPPTKLWGIPAPKKKKYKIK